MVLVAGQVSAGCYEHSADRTGACQTQGVKRLLVALVVFGSMVPAGARADWSLPKPEPFVTGLDFAANIAFAPDGRIFIAEKDSGDIIIAENGRLLEEPFAHLDVVGSGEQGLLGIALDPGFPDEPWVYVYYSDPNTRLNLLARLRADENTAVGRPQILFEALTTENGYHNGGDIAFGPDGKLYLSVGEVHEPARAQDPGNLGGKVLRLNPDGSIPSDNPFGPQNPVYSLGHRNSFGLCFDPSTGDLWETENGPGSFDEVNLIRAGGNYGWPDQLGPGAGSTFTDPVLAFEDVIVPTGCAVSGGVLYFGSFAYGEVYRLPLPVREGPAKEVKVASLPEGITDMQAGPDEALYVVTPSTVYRYGGESPSIVESPSPSSAAATGASPQRPPPVAGPDDGRSSGAPLLAIAAAVALALGLMLRVAAGRRIPREADED